MTGDIVIPLHANAEDPRVQAFVTYLSGELSDFTKRNGPPLSIAFVLLGDIQKAPFAYEVQSWTPGDEKPPKAVVQSLAASLLQAAVSNKMIEASQS